MPALTATGFSVIDTYNIIREDMQTSEGGYEEEFDPLADQQGIPQFSFSSSSSTPSSFPTEQTTASNVQQLTGAYSSPSPSPSPSYSPSPSPGPQSRGQAQGQGLTYEISDQQIQSFLDMEVSASFLEELIGQPSTVPVPSPSPTPPSQPPHTTTVLTNYVAEAAAAGCTVVEINAEARDQQLLDVDLPELYDLDRHSFYDDVVMDSKVKDAGSGPYMNWMEELPGPREPEPVVRVQQQQQQQLSPVGPSLTELGPVAGSEQEDLLSAFDSLRRDILVDCKQLNISSNPKTWSSEDSRSWVTYMLDKTQRSDDCSACLALPGPVLCQKSREELVRASPGCGEILHDQLQLWIALADLPTLPASKPQQQSLPSLPPVTEFQLSPPQSSTTPLSRSSPSVSPAPSTDSVCSSQSSSSSSLSSYSEAEMMPFWCQESSEEDLFHDSSANLTSADQPQSTVPSKTSSSSKRQTSGRPGKQIRLWEFLKELLEDNDASMKWLDRTRGIFKIEDSNRVARLWGSRKNHPAMNYDKLSRSVRQYYKKGIIKKTTQTRRLVYQFCERYL